MKDWQKYQENAAKFFRCLGLSAVVEDCVRGARGEHEIDVHVKGSLHGIAFNWIIECKAWRTNIPKEKVLALAEIVQDVGADRGFLLSEIGFQSGAVLQAAKRNITLTSLQDLREAVKSSMNEQVLSRLSWRADRAKAEYWRRHYEGKKYLTELLISPHWFYLDYLSVVFDQAASERYPLVYKFDSACKLELIAHSIDELIPGLNELVSAAEKDLTAEGWPPEER
jgi:Restriction endonuclease